MYSSWCPTFSIYVYVWFLTANALIAMKASWRRFDNPRSVCWGGVMKRSALESNRLLLWMLVYKLVFFRETITVRHQSVCFSSVFQCLVESDRKAPSQFPFLEEICASGKQPPSASTLGGARLCGETTLKTNLDMAFIKLSLGTGNMSYTVWWNYFDLKGISDKPSTAHRYQERISWELRNK